MTTLEHTGLAQIIEYRSRDYGNLRASILLLSAGAISVAGIVLGNYYLIAALPAVFLVLRYPLEMTLGLFAFLIPFDNVLLVGQSGYNVDWALGAGTGVVLLAYGMLSGRLTMPSRSALWWGLFVLWCAATYLWALDPTQVMDRLPSAIFLFLLYFVVVSFRVTTRELTAVVLFTIAGGVFASGYAMREFAHGIGWFSRAALVVSNHQVNPNDFADSLLLPFSLAVGGFLAARTFFMRGSMLTAATVIGICELLTMSRGSLLALVALLLVYMIRLGIRTRILIPIVIVSAFLTVAPSFFFQRIQQAAGDRASGRWDVLVVGMQVVKHYGVLGVGLENFRVGYAKFAGFAPVFRGYDPDPHNIYLQAWAELGIVGLLLLLLAVGSHLRDLHSANRQARGAPNYFILAIEAACWAVLIHGLAANLLWRKQFWLVWMLAALAVQWQRVAASDERPLCPVVAPTTPIVDFRSR